MTTEQTPPPSQGTWGAPVPAAERPRTPWSTRKIVISAVIAVVIVAGGTAAVIAATNNSATTTGTGGPGGGAGVGQGGPGGGFGGGGGFGRGAASGLAALTTALHGDFVVANGSTERLQTGVVTAVSATDITVKSTDGYTQSYAVGSNTSVDRGQDSIGKVATGNTVTVIATLSGQNGTASTIEDTSIDSGQFTGPGGAPGGFGGRGAN